LNERKNDWEDKAKKSKNTYDFLKYYIYDEHPWGHIPMEEDLTNQKYMI
jgi:hypothetical protein